MEGSAPATAVRHSVKNAVHVGERRIRISTDTNHRSLSSPAGASAGGTPISSRHRPAMNSTRSASVRPQPSGLFVARMMPIVAPADVIHRHLGIDLRRLDAFVTEELFDRHQVHAALMEMRRDRMAHRVRRDLSFQPAELDVERKDAADLLITQAAVAAAHEQGPVGAGRRHADTLAARTRSLR